jgi:hypothetical protein
MGWIRYVATATLALALVLMALPAGAQPCNRSCNIADRDERGCCPATPKAVDPKPAPSKPTPAKPANPPATSKPRPTNPANARPSRPESKAPARQTGIEVRADADKNLFGAAVSVDDQPKGQVPMMISAPPGRHLVEIKKEGFERFSQWIDVPDGQVQILMPVLKEIPKARLGMLVVDADVANAEVYIDGNKHPDTTPVVISDLVEGLHVIEVRKAPAVPWKQTVSVNSGRQTRVRAELAATAHPTGVIRVLCDAPGARAVLDGVDLGPVPVDIKDIKPGEHILQVKAPKFQTGEQRVTVSAGSSQIAKFDLTPDLGADEGILIVRAASSTAQLFIDGAYAGLANPYNEVKVSAGEHVVRVRLQGTKEFFFEERVRVSRGGRLVVDAGRPR